MIKVKLLSEGILKEEVIGAQAFVYHGSRTEPDKMLDIIKNNEFDPGNVAGAMYGPGLYTVYNLLKTNTDKGRYGKFVYKFKINMYGFIIFDSEIAEKVYGKPLKPHEQAKLLGYDFLLDILKDSSLGRNGYITSDHALILAEHLTNRKVKIKGIVFTGRNDGPVAVIYDYSSAIITSYRDESKTWKKFDVADIKGQIKSTLNKPLYDIPKIIKNNNRKRMLATTKEHDEDVELEVQDLRFLNKKAIFNKGLKLIEISYELIEKYLKNIQLGTDLVLLGYTSDTIPNIFDLSKTGLYLDDCEHLQELPENLIIGKSLRIEKCPRLRLPRGLVIGGSLWYDYFSDDHMSIDKALPKDIIIKGKKRIEFNQPFILPNELWIKYVMMLKEERPDEFAQLQQDFKIAKEKIDQENIRTRGWA